MFCVTDALDWYEAWHSSTYRQKSVDEIYKHICADDTVSHGISIGPVSAYQRKHVFLLSPKRCLICRIMDASTVDLDFYLRQGGNVFAGVCLCVRRITQKVMDGSF